MTALPDHFDTMTKAETRDLIMSLKSSEAIPF